MTHESTPRVDERSDVVGAHRTRTWPWFLAAVWLVVLALAPWVVRYAALVWDRGHAPVLYVVPSGGFADVPPLPGLTGLTGHIVPLVSLLCFLTLLPLPVLALVTFGLGAASIGPRSPPSRRAIAALASSLIAVVLVPWASVIMASGNDPAPPSATTGSLVLLGFLGLSAAVPLVGYSMIGPVAYPATQTPSQPSPGWYADPGSVAQLRWWDGSGWTDSTS